MLLVKPNMIPEIDRYLTETLLIPAKSLMKSSGRAVANAINDNLAQGSRIVILAGKGNNGGDGYALALEIMNNYKVTVYDVFSSGQRSEEGKYFLDRYLSSGGVVKPLILSDASKEEILGSDAIVDAIFGTGFSGSLPSQAEWCCEVLNDFSGLKIAVDVPLGVCADTGRVEKCAVKADITVELSFVKRGLLSYPAREYVGEIMLDDLRIPKKEIMKAFCFEDYYVDSELARELLPKRRQNTSKGSFGKVLLLCGSAKYRGAAHLSLEGALRGGAGLSVFAGEDKLAYELLQKFPEALYEKISELSKTTPEQIDKISAIDAGCNSTVIGSGSSVSDGLYSLVLALLKLKGSPIVLDADAINVLSQRKDEGISAIKNAKRQVILTPHPLELSRLLGVSVDDVQKNRIEIAYNFAKENNCILLLKGKATIVTDGKELYINSTGSSALSKGGSGDVLAGVIGSMLASGYTPIKCVAAAAYYHALAGDMLANEYSEYSVTPSDLPKEIGRQIAKSLRA